MTLPNRCRPSLNAITSLGSDGIVSVYSTGGAPIVYGPLHIRVAER